MTDGAVVGTAKVKVAVDKADKIGADVVRQSSAGMQNAGRSLSQSFGKAFQGGFSSIKALGGGGVSGILGDLGGLIGPASVAGAIAGVRKIADATASYAAEVRKVKAITGSSAEDASKLTATFHKLGIETDSIVRPMATLSSSLQSGGGKLKQYFTNAELATLKSNDLAKDIPLLAAKFQSLEDPIQKNAFLMDTFGKRGLAMRAVLSLTQEQFKAFGDEAKRAGLVMSDTDLKAAKDFQFAMRGLGETAKGLEVQIGKRAIPVLTDLGVILQKATAHAGETEDATSGVGRAAHDLGNVFNFVQPHVKLASELIHKFAGTNDEAKKAVQELADEQEKTAAEAEDRAKKLAAGAAEGLKIFEQASRDLETRVDALLPKLGDGFQKVELDVSTMGKQFTDNADAIASFTVHLQQLRGQLAKVGVSDADANAMLARLQALGPGAEAAITSLTNVAPEKLKGLATAFATEIKAAKAAADLEFDKYPANFAQKIGAANSAASKALEDIVAEFRALPQNIDPGGQWATKLQDMAFAIDSMAQQGIIRLSPLQQGFLLAAESADTAEGKASALQNLIDSMHGKTVVLDADTQRAQAGIKLVEQKIGEIDGTVFIRVVHEGPILPGDITAASQAEHQGRAYKPPQKRALGGPVIPGQPYLVGENGPEIRYFDRPGYIAPVAQSRGGGAPTVVQVVLDGRVIAETTAPHSRDLARSYR